MTDNSSSHADAVSEPLLSRHVFEKYDKDGNGSIDSHEFHLLCYDMGYYLTKKEREIALQKLDANGDGVISYEEFQNWWRDDGRFENLRLSKEELQRLEQVIHYFRFYDKDNSGLLDREEFKHMHEDLVKHNLAPEGLTSDELFEHLDADRNGSISFNEFLNFLDVKKINKN